MARGGLRPRAGRKRGGKNKRPHEAASPPGEMPIDYLLRKMRDGEIDPLRRDALAVTAGKLIVAEKRAAGAKSKGRRAESEEQPGAGADDAWKDLPAVRN